MKILGFLKSSWKTLFLDGWLTLFLLAASLAFNVYLSLELNEMGGRLSLERSREEIRIGSKIGAISGTDLRGQATTYQWPGTGQETIVYVFSPTCSWCNKNVDNILALQKKALNKKVIGLSLSSEGLAEYVSKHNLTFPILSAPKLDNKQDAPFKATPQTLLVSDSGVVLAAWTGAYVGNTKTLIEQKLGVELPGLNP